MDKHIDYLGKLYNDLLQQFKGKQNITVFQKAMARQLEELYAFFYELRVMRWLQNAEGVQLDGIGNIVDLSRTDALVWSNLADQDVPMDDDLYRKYLMFKIFLNTSEGTYKEVYRTLKMFWPYTPIVYSEQQKYPATMFWELAGPTPGGANLNILRIAERVKAAGVALRFDVISERDEVEFEVTVIGAAFPSNSSKTLPRHVPEFDFETDIYTGAQSWRYSETTLPPLAVDRDFVTELTTAMYAWAFSSRTLPDITAAGSTGILQLDDASIEAGWLQVDGGDILPARIIID